MKTQKNGNGRPDRRSSPPPAGESTTTGVVGHIRVHPAGYGFVQRDDGEDDVFVSRHGRGTAMDGDRVSLRAWMGYKGMEGRVTEVLSRGRARVTGVLRGRGQKAYLEPDDPRLTAEHPHIHLPEGGGSGRSGQAVVAEITHYPSRPDEPVQARVIQVLGEPGRPSIEIAKILVCADIPDGFPQEVAHAGARAPADVRPEDLVDRLDLRDRAFLTIDPETARDFDDAVCVEPGSRGGCDRLWVAVADVSHYVPRGGVLDQEARVRGCSVYLPDRCIPMLPTPLSAGICSLNPDVDRLAMVVGLDVDREGRVTGEHMAAAVIHSHGRLDYGGVAVALSGGAGAELRGTHARYRDHLPQLQRLREVASRLREQRLRRGALDFDLPEAKVILDEQDPERVCDVVRAKQNPAVRDAYRLVEDCMLAANEAVARFFRQRGADTIYRVHDTPDEERLQAFAALAKGHGLSFDPEAARKPLYLRGFLEQLQGRPMEQALSYLLLRALKKAHYDITPIGHFGLGAPDYLHFTSPIRRYPDLICHRLLKIQLRREGLPGGGMVDVGKALPPKAELQVLARESSLAERRAMEVERDVVDMYRAALMQDQVGQQYDGTVVGVTAFGIFVALDAPYVEGLIKIDRLGDDYAFDQQTMRLAPAHGRGGGQAYSLGDRVRVQIEGVSIARRKIDLALVAHTAAEATPPAPGKEEARPGKRRRARQKKAQPGEA